jgi:hypothetical protein
MNTVRNTADGEGLIAGREYMIQQPLVKKGTTYRQKPKARYLIDGINHPKGEPIRFKSREGAERHLKNIGADA